jgi:mRNA interferase RelE/StbE
MHELIFTSKFLSQLKKLETDLQRRIISTLERAQIRPERHFERLVAEKSYKLRVGNYRVIADIDNKNLIILVLEIGHRRNIYKK